jgi:hypothetical protein
MNPQPSKQFLANLIAFRREQFVQTLADNEALLADGFEEALIGHTNGHNVVAVYDYDLCVQILMEREGMSTEDAIEFMEFNVVGSYVGEKTPIFISLS